MNLSNYKVGDVFTVNTSKGPVTGIVSEIIPVDGGDTRYALKFLGTYTEAQLRALQKEFHD